MSMFQQREESFENAFARREEFRFRALARRNKLLGLWVAEKLGASGVDARIYVDKLVRAATVKNSGEVVVARVLEDFTAVGVPLSERQIRRRMGELLKQAITEIKTGAS